MVRRELPEARVLLGPQVPLVQVVLLGLRALAARPELPEQRVIMGLPVVPESPELMVLPEILVQRALREVTVLRGQQAPLELKVRLGSLVQPAQPALVAQQDQREEQDQTAPPE